MGFGRLKLVAKLDGGLGPLGRAGWAARRPAAAMLQGLAWAAGGCVDAAGGSGLGRWGCMYMQSIAMLSSQLRFGRLGSPVNRKSDLV